jgi:hypothetical protein
MIISNRHKGTNFEDIAKKIICDLKGITLIKDVKVDVGISNRKKDINSTLLILKKKCL